MTALNPSLVADIAAACTSNVADAAEALTRAFDSKITLGAVKPGTYAVTGSTPAADGRGLVVLLTFGDEGLAVVLPESSGALPAWYAAPDATGDSKLSTLAEELGKLLVPETLAAGKFQAVGVESIGQALGRAGVAADTSAVTIEVTSEAGDGQLTLVWPLSAPTALFQTPNSDSPTASAAASAASPAGGASADPEARGAPKYQNDLSLDELPPYSRSLLKIRLPVSVQLANKKESVFEIVEIVPGGIIKFDKGCDELLEMVVGGQTIAVGEAVKVGDKFGFRITSMQLPQEHFIPVRRPAVVR